MNDNFVDLQKDCGSGAGGFKPGNSCGGGGDGGSATADVKPPSPSLSAPKKHDAAIPANPRRMTVDQFSAGLAAMGYTEVSTRTENPNSRLERRQFFTLRDAKGNESEAEMNDILSSMYASSSDPKLAKVKPVRRTKSASCGCGCESTRVVSHKNMWSYDSMVCKAARKPSASTAANEFDNITKDETAIGKAVDKILRKQIDAVMKKLNASIVPTPELTLEVEQMLMSSKWDRQLVEAMRPYLQRSLQQGITLGFETIKKLASSVPDFNPQTANLDAYVKSESVRLARGIARGVKQYTAVKVKTLLGEGIQAGETAQQLSSRVMEWAGEKGDAERSTRSRALTIARTEANRASRKAESEAWRSTGLVEGKTWLLAPDPCEFCEAASEMFGETSVGIDDAFFAQGEILKGADDNEMILDYEAIDGPPLHPNCRCSMQPRLIDDYEAVIKEMEAEAAAQDGPYEESQ